MAGHWYSTASSWPSKDTMLRRRNSDTHLLANPISRIKKLELSRQHSLPESNSRQLDKIFESVDMGGAHQDDVWLHDAGIHAKIVHTMDAHCPRTVEVKVPVKHGDKKGLYARRSSLHSGMFDRASKTLYSSDPDIYTAQANLSFPDMPTGHLSLHDLTDDLEHVDQAVGHQSVTAPSRGTNIFSAILPHSQVRRSRKGLRLSRKHSLDSHLVSQSQQHTSRTAQSKRAIKISRPDHLSAMYISGVDTLGGLPDDEDGQRLHRKHLLARLGGPYLELDPHGALSRGSSCPVIFEGEESDESVEAGKQLYLSSSLDRGSRLLSLAHRDDVFTSDQSTSSSGELSYSLSSQVSDKADQSGHFFIGSDPFDGSDEIEQANSPKLSKRGTSMASTASVVEAPRTSPLLLGRENHSLGESGHPRYARELKVKPDQLVRRQQATPRTAGPTSKKQPESKGDAATARAEMSQATVHHGMCNLETSAKDNHRHDSKDVKSAPKTGSHVITEASSGDSDSSTSQSHPSSVTSSADESSS